MKKLWLIIALLIGREQAMATVSPVIRHELDNGMTILVRPLHEIPKVSVQLWYNVGSKDEKTGEKGIAHLIEHMIFKGTQGKKSLNLSETDINIISHMLSATCNAFTGHDYTGYLFNLPKQHWYYALPIMADCMSHCAFKDDHLNSEMKAVIQELKMRRDNYILSLAEAMITAIFNEHPYHYPIIGYKQDLWNLHGEDLHKFYKKHYSPNSATLVVVGDVEPEEVVEQAKKYFGSIPNNPHYAKELYYLNKDIIAKSVTLYRDVQQPVMLLAWLVPGSEEKKDHVLEIISWLLGQGKGSRLYKKIVDEQQLAYSLSTFTYNFFEHSLFFIAIEPTSIEATETIIKEVEDEIAQLVDQGPDAHELTRAIKKAKMSHYGTLENSQEQAYEIGKYFLATGDENYADIYARDEFKHIDKEIHDILVSFRPTTMHKGMLLPLPTSELPLWNELQKESDALDASILAARVRSTPLEKPHYASKVNINPPKPFKFPKPTTYTLDNGLKLFTYQRSSVPKVDIVLELKAKAYYDPADKQGLYNFVAEMMTEGTENYSAAEFADELESRGMAINVTPNVITLTVLKEDVAKGLELLYELLTRATFEEAQIEKVRAQLLSQIKSFWDDPRSFVGQLVKEQIYQKHPYAKNPLGTQASIGEITRDDLVEFYETYISPRGARIAVVGDIEPSKARALVEQELGAWTGSEIETLEFPGLENNSYKEHNYPIKRDQVLLCYAGLSVDRSHKDYDKLLLFDQILCGGAIGSMSSRLFKLREQSGLFYTIGGSLVSQATEQPGMIMVNTLVSLDRLKEAEDAIKQTLRTAADKISETEFEEAKNAILNALVTQFESNKGIGQAFIFLDRYQFPSNYFDARAAALDTCSIKDVQDAVKKRLLIDKFATIRIGRV